MWRYFSLVSFAVPIFVLAASLPRQKPIKKSPMQIPASAAIFCDILMLGEPGPFQSLALVSQALGLGDLGLGWMAKNSQAKFERYGFVNLLVKKPLLLSFEAEIPDGSVFILDNPDLEGGGAVGCPVNPMFGHVAVKCGAGQVFWGSGGRVLSYEDFLNRNRNCVKAVMANPNWP